MRLKYALSLLSAAATSTTLIAVASAQTFSDVPQDHYAYSAIEYLKANGVVSGYDDGTFRPAQAVNRAEAMKLIIAPILNEESRKLFETSAFSDVPDDAWFLPFVEYGRKASVIDGPPAKEVFRPGDTVIKAEFLKMLMLAQDINPDSYGEIRLPLSTDVSNVDEWYYPYMLYAIASSMTMISQNGTLDPGRKLTRADTAVLLHRLLTYQEGRRTQALLSEAESEILIVLGTLENNDPVQAEYASARGLLAARGAHASRPDEPVVLGALKVTESFRALVRAYRAGLNAELDEVIRLAGDAWNLSAKAQELNPEISELSEKVQQIAKNMADEARTIQASQ